MPEASRVVLLTGATEPLGVAIARAVLDAGGRVAATVSRPWQVDRLREQLPSADLLVGVVMAGDAEAAAGFVKGANDALGPITDLVAASILLRDRVAGREPAGDLGELLDANLHANTTVARALLPSLRRRRSGRLAFASLPESAHHLSATCRASLAAIDAFATSLRADFAGTDLDLHFTHVPATTDTPTPWLQK
jgi:NADP-dependent 3-hydroxy acid dehydrogenase YdfG